MILDLEKFVAEEQPYWEELKLLLDNNGSTRTLDEVRRFHYLYERVSADLIKLRTFSNEPKAISYLEGLVAEAYADIHSVEKKISLMPLFTTLFIAFPITFRKHIKAFYLAVGITLLGAAFGAYFLHMNEEHREDLFPKQFGHLYTSPSERVAEEEKSQGSQMSGQHSTFAAQLMTHNIKVSLFAMALGLTLGIGTTILLFYNGLILGAVVFDYLNAGEGLFLTGWLLPHGSVEIPAIILGGQAAYILASALLGNGERSSLKMRFSSISDHILHIVCGIFFLLVWAGIIEAFISQYHSPTLYWPKIIFGVFQLSGLILWLSLAGRKRQEAMA